MLLFQKEKPLIHKVYFEQIDVVYTFLTYFIKSEKLGVSGKKDQSFRDH